MDQIFIRIKKGENFYNKDIRDSSVEERTDWYNTLSKGQIMSILEQSVVNKLAEENRL